MSEFDSWWEDHTKLHTKDPASAAEAAWDGLRQKMIDILQEEIARASGLAWQDAISVCTF